MDFRSECRNDIAATRAKGWLILNRNESQSSSHKHTYGQTLLGEFEIRYSFLTIVFFLFPQFSCPILEQGNFLAWSSTYLFLNMFPNIVLICPVPQTNKLCFEWLILAALSWNVNRSASICLFYSVLIHWWMKLDVVQTWIIVFFENRFGSRKAFQLPEKNILHLS